MTKISLSLFKLIFFSHEYIIDQKNESCIIYLDIYEQYQTHIHAEWLYIYIRRTAAFI